MEPGKAEQLLVAGEKADSHGEHLCVLCGMEQCLAAEHGRHDRISVIDSGLGTGGDSILAFPELNKPGLFLIVKIYGLRVQNHIHGRSGQIVKFSISEGFLPGVGPGGKDILLKIIAESKGFGKLVEKLAFLSQRHVGYPVNDALFSAVVEDTKENQEDKKDKK